MNDDCTDGDYLDYASRESLSRLVRILETENEQFRRMVNCLRRQRDELVGRLSTVLHAIPDDGVEGEVKAGIREFIATLRGADGE